MAHAVAHSRALVGVRAPSVEVEVDLAGGLPALAIVGLPEAAVKEARDRVRTALTNSGFQFPTARVTVNLAPADLPKAGGRFDLPIALGILAASGQLPPDRLTGVELMGELTLDGRLRPVRGTLAAALEPATERHTLILPSADAPEAAAAGTVDVCGADSLTEVTAHLLDQSALPVAAPYPASGSAPPDLADVRGQAAAKRALEVAAAGGHNLLLSGPPGAGKTLLARCLPGILPPLAKDGQVEVARIRSVAGEADVTLDPTPPFRAPHHSATLPALVGGGSPPEPGEISRAHRGLLFLDELPEFPRRTLEALREPLETGHIRVARAQGTFQFPAHFQLAAAMNPCPCGHLGDSHHACTCTPAQIRQYRARLSGPLLDRIDIQLEVPALAVADLRPGAGAAEEASATVAERVQAARQRQVARQGVPGAALDAAGVERHCHAEPEALDFLESACRRLGFSARAYHRILKLARTIADLEASEPVRRPHVAEAVQFRRLEADPSPA